MIKEFSVGYEYPKNKSEVTYTTSNIVSVSWKLTWGYKAEILNAKKENGFYYFTLCICYFCMKIVMHAVHCSTFFYPFLKLLYISVPCKPNKPYNTFHCMFPAEKLIACMFSQTRVLWKEFLHIVSVFSFIRGMSSAYFFPILFQKEREKMHFFNIIIYHFFSPTDLRVLHYHWSQLCLTLLVPAPCQCHNQNLQAQH